MKSFLPTSRHRFIAVVLVAVLVGCGQVPHRTAVRVGVIHRLAAVDLPAVPQPPPPPPPPSDVEISSPGAGPLPGQGLPLSGPIAYPLMVQVENTYAARPQVGIAAASVVFEYITEGGITRFSALFHRVPGVVGPVRSARFASVYLYRHFGALMMASGGSGFTYAKIFADNSAGLSTIINDFDHGVHFFRWGGRAAPHDLFTSQAQMLSAAHSGARPPRAGDFLRSDTWPGGAAATTVNVPALRSNFAFDGKSYSVATDGASQDDAAFGPIRAQGVVVMHVNQWVTPHTEDSVGSNARDFDLNSGGPAEMYAHGSVVNGRWISSSEREPLGLVDGAGNPVGMPPGLTWVLLAP